MGKPTLGEFRALAQNLDKVDVLLCGYCHKEALCSRHQLHIDSIHQPLASFPEQQSISYPQCLYLPPGGNNIGCPDQEIDLEAKTLGVPPPPSYDDLFKN